jgi:hypothetical protein
MPKRPRRRSKTETGPAWYHVESHERGSGSDPEAPALPQRRLDALSKEAAKPLFPGDQFKVVMKTMDGEPILPTDEDFAGVEEP